MKTEYIKPESNLIKRFYHKHHQQMSIPRSIPLATQYNKLSYCQRRSLKEGPWGCDRYELPRWLNITRNHLLTGSWAELWTGVPLDTLIWQKTCNMSAETTSYVRSLSDQNADSVLLKNVYHLNKTKNTFRTLIYMVSLTAVQDFIFFSWYTCTCTVYIIINIK